MDARELVEAAKNRLNTSQTRLAKDLGISGASLSELAAGKKELSDETYIKLAKLAGVDPTEVIIEKHMKKAGPEGRVVWANLAKALPKKSAMIGLSVILLMPAPQSHANTPTTNIKSGGQVLIM